MASSVSRRLCRTFLSTNPKIKPSNFSPYPFCTNSSLSSAETASERDEAAFSDNESDPFSSSASSKPNNQQRAIVNRPLENGVDIGVYKAILVGQVGQAPFQKRLRSGRTITLLSLGTGGIRNNRRPLDDEEPRDYSNRCSVQWHRVSVYPERLGELAMKNVVLGSILYIEGNLENKIFNDPITGLVRRMREIAIRRNGRLVFLGQGTDGQKSSRDELKSVGYY